MMGRKLEECQGSCLPTGTHIEGGREPIYTQHEAMHIQQKGFGSGDSQFCLHLCIPGM